MRGVTGSTRICNEQFANLPSSRSCQYLSEENHGKISPYALSAPVSTTALLGACGSFTMFSSFAVDTVKLWEDTRPRVAAGYAAANIVGALLAISIAYVLTL